MVEPLFLKPVFKEKMWGGRHLEKFGYKLSSDHIGECWGISAHPKGVTVINNGLYKGVPLDVLFEKHRELFGNSNSQKFPLLIKILDANDDLSVQVHPDDEYANKNEHENGKTECWYILSADLGSKLIYGHNAKDKKEFQYMVKHNKWNRLLKYISVNSGDFLYVPSGTVHAIGKGIMALEIQQSSDITYRLYDFDRINPLTGKKRSLHINKAIDVIKYYKNDRNLLHTSANNIETKYLVKSPYFNVAYWNLDNEKQCFYKTALYTLVTVINGKGILLVDNKEYPLLKGQHFILSSTINEWAISGKISLVAAEVND